MNRFYIVLCRWCKTVGSLLVLVGLANFFVVISSWAQQDKQLDAPAQLWPQLLNAGLFTAVGVAVIVMFFKFKDESTRQATQDREAASIQLQSAKDELADDMHTTNKAIQELTFVLKGVDGRGGIMTAIELDQKRRHAFSNQIMTLQGAVIEILETVAVLCQKANVPFNRNIIQEVMNSGKQVGDTL